MHDESHEAPADRITLPPLGPSVSGHSPWSTKPKRLPPPHWNAADGWSPRERQNSGDQLIASV